VHRKAGLACLTGSRPSAFTADLKADALANHLVAIVPQTAGALLASVPRMV